MDGKTTAPAGESRPPATKDDDEPIALCRYEELARRENRKRKAR